MRKVEISTGTVTVDKPGAKARNMALIEAEKNGVVHVDKKGKTSVIPSQSTFIATIVPYCVKGHPWGTVKVRDALDSLSTDDYDIISKAVSQEMSGLSDEEIKNSEPQSNQDECPAPSN